MNRDILVKAELQPYIERPPVAKEQLYSQACSNDEVTINSWRDQWIRQFKENQAKYGPFKNNGIGQLWSKERHKPVIIAGSGPSLKLNAKDLLNKKDICLVSCLHNFQYFEDLGIETDYYVTLDAGEVTVEEVYEGGTKTPDEYWELTKKRTLIAFVGTHPKLLANWQGKVIFYNCPVPDKTYLEETEKIEKYNQYVATGGNVLGACLYIARGWLGAGSVAFIGADFSFDHASSKFHAWDSKYDNKLGYYIKVPDIFGLPVKTWQSYNNFKSWFDHVTITVPAVYFNCTEGGTLGAYQGGNLLHIKQCPLKDFLKMYNVYEELHDQVLDPENAQKKLLF